MGGGVGLERRATEEVEAEQSSVLWEFCHTKEQLRAGSWSGGWGQESVFRWG